MCPEIHMQLLILFADSAKIFLFISVIKQSNVILLAGLIIGFKIILQTTHFLFLTLIYFSK